MTLTDWTAASRTLYLDVRGHTRGQSTSSLLPKYTSFVGVDLRSNCSSACLVSSTFDPLRLKDVVDALWQGQQHGAYGQVAPGGEGAWGMRPRGWSARSARWPRSPSLSESCWAQVLAGIEWIAPRTRHTLLSLPPLQPPNPQCTSLPRSPSCRTRIPPFVSLRS
jgi:hypothetical protein